ncbi:hypothetical protein [Spiroplasma platyhelix]|uniref:Uncharacterized protein n=1 Tax=Spiroplasma platyhelix PALS-1 TaxID=1276218 RepID=A0A846TQY1_9MOLU|nr:hypothetical protein [Spiroplasma platyhelix]MBE4704378.1 hypothetical protein [Spiroplasma platyhelix PALS-1]NKE38750.1 hypothetical protein [Spiroplasma platyhelix PALS-1]UJB28961.1 hypothetical protein SPLAT_v1c01960 [Spiroplasma platyhelix PALS-1]
MDLKSSWWMLLLMAVVLIIFIVSSVGSKKRKRQEKQKRQKEVKEVIKNYMRDELNLRHKTVEFDQVIARSSKDYRYRDVFDVVVKLYDSKKNDLYATKAFEVEGFAKQISKKEFETIWKVNSELDFDETLKRITLEKRKSKKIKKKTVDDKKLIAEEKAALKASIQEEKQLAKERKSKVKNYEKPKVPVGEKFTGLKD